MRSARNDGAKLRWLNSSSFLTANLSQPYENIWKRKLDTMNCETNPPSGSLKEFTDKRGPGREAGHALPRRGAAEPHKLVSALRVTIVAANGLQQFPELVFAQPSVFDYFL